MLPTNLYSRSLGPSQSTVAWGAVEEAATLEKLGQQRASAEQRKRQGATDLKVANLVAGREIGGLRQALTDLQVCLAVEVGRLDVAHGLGGRQEKSSGEARGRGKCAPARAAGSGPSRVLCPCWRQAHLGLAGGEQDEVGRKVLVVEHLDDVADLDLLR